MGDANNHSDRARGPVVFVACFVVSVVWSAFAIWSGRAINDPAVPYILYQLIVGFVAGMITPRWVWGAWVGTFLGQGIVFLVSDGLAANSTAGIGFVLLPVFCLPTLFGTALGALVRSKKS